MHKKIKVLFFGVVLIMASFTTSLVYQNGSGHDNVGIQISLIDLGPDAYAGKCKATANCTSGDGSVSCTGSKCTSGVGWVKCDGESTCCQTTNSNET